MSHDLEDLLPIQIMLMSHRVLPSYLPVITKHFLTPGCASCATRVSKRCMFYEMSRRGDYKYDKMGRELDQVAFESTIKLGAMVFKEEFKLLWQETKEWMKMDNPVYSPGEVVKVWKFDSQAAIDEWRVSVDQDWDEGFSYASFTRSPAGYGLFSGYLDSETLPKDRTVTRTGWANITSPFLRRPFFREGRYNWEFFTHLVMRVRGDGRTYAICIRTPGTMDIHWFQLYTFGLYTHGGPYWQFVRIPFSRFVFTSKGAVQDYQEWMPMDEIKSFGITMIDKNTGPFKLEIDYIGIEIEPGYDQKTVYESYYVPQAKYVGE